MQVKRLSRTVDGLETIYTACKTCVSELPPNVIFEDIFDEIEPPKGKLINLVKKVIKSGHHSVLEHYYFTFAISGVSRACTHQLVRHRHMSFSQKSQRYVTETGQFEYIVPEEIKKADIVSTDYGDFTAEMLMDLLSQAYSGYIKQGIPPEDARSILPNAATSSMVASLNLRELIHLASLRLCTNAQQEIREVVGKMCDLVVEKEPWLKEYLVSKCKSLGYCDEIRSCKMMKSKKEVVRNND